MIWPIFCKLKEVQKFQKIKMVVAAISAVIIELLKAIKLLRIIITGLRIGLKIVKVIATMNLIFMAGLKLRWGSQRVNKLLLRSKKTQPHS